MFDRGANRLVCAMAVLASLWVGGAALAQVSALPPETERLEPHQRRELDHLLADLLDARLDLSRRRVAATIVLDRQWPAGERELRRLLMQGEDLLVLRAIVRGAAHAQKPPARLLPALLSLVGSPEASLRTDVAAALGRFEHPELMSRLVSMARDSRGAAPKRLGAVRALGEQRSRESAAALIQIVDASGEDPAVRAAAFDALSRLTGLSDPGHDASAWRRWWSVTGALEGADWTRELMRTISARNHELADRLNVVSNRLTDLHAQLYDTSGEEGRPAILQRMLADELPEVRSKGLWLVEQRLLNNQQVSDATRAAMRKALADPSPTVRTQAARLLEVLADEIAAELAADMLPVETDPQVQMAYLRLLARVPIREAVEPALGLLLDTRLRSAAAGFALAASERELLSAQQVQSMVQVARQAITDPGDSADPAMLRLLGRLGGPEDEALVSPYVRSGPLTSRIAAVEAFENEQWSTGPLLEQLSDPSLRPAVWKLLARRGRTAAICLSLLNHPPADADERAAWIRVIATVASRLNLADLGRVNEVLSGNTELRDVREAVLLSAARLGPDGLPVQGATNGQSPGDATAEQTRLEAELMLAEFYLQAGDPGKARPILRRLADRTGLTVEHRRRVELGRLRRMLQQQALDEASTHTSELLTMLNGPPTDQIASVWLEAAELALSANQPADAATLAGKLAELLGPKLDSRSQARLAELKRKLPPPDPSSAADASRS